jgi:hypothetical protein
MFHAVVRNMWKSRVDSFDRVVSKCGEYSVTGEATRHIGVERQNGTMQAMPAMLARQVRQVRHLHGRGALHSVGFATI